MTGNQLVTEQKSSSRESTKGFDSSLKSPNDGDLRFLCDALWLFTLVVAFTTSLHSLSLGQTETIEVHRQRIIRFAGSAMGMQYDCQISDEIDPNRILHLQAKTARELERLEGIFSLYDSRSILSQWNSSPSTEWTAVPGEVIELLDFANQLHRATKGRFDPTIAPLSKLWRIGSIDLNWSPPAESEIQAVKEYVGLHRIEWESSPPRLRKSHPRVAIDLNALVEGLALRKLSQQLDEHPIHNYLLHLGGEYLAKGSLSPHEDWNVYLEEPRYEVGVPGSIHLAFSVPLRSQSISTSGNYRTGKEHDKKRYSHFIDPHTGFAMHEVLRSVSVVSRDPLEADGWASALMLLEPEEAIRLAEEHDLAVCVSKSDGWLKSREAIQADCFRVLSDRGETEQHVDLSGAAPFGALWQWLQFVWFACLSILLLAKIGQFVRVLRR